MKNKQTFEVALNKLESIVEKMESGDLDINSMLKLFEEGTKLSQFFTHTIRFERFDPTNIYEF